MKSFLDFEHVAQSVERLTFNEVVVGSIPTVLTISLPHYLLNFMSCTSLRKSAFSLIELSIVILIVGILVAGVTQGSRLIRSFKLSNARTVTNSSPVQSIKDLVLWLDATAENKILNRDGSSYIDNEEYVSSWKDSNVQNLGTTPCVQNTADEQPQYISDAINGIPAIRLSEDSPDVNITCGLPTSINVSNTIFMVVSWRAESSILTTQFFTIASSTSQKTILASVISNFLLFIIDLDLPIRISY